MEGMLRRLGVVVLLVAILSSCAIVPRNRRKHLADPTMQPTDDPLRESLHSKIHTSREGAAGGDGEPAGGGCGCN